MFDKTTEAAEDLQEKLEALQERLQPALDHIEKIQQQQDSIVGNTDEITEKIEDAQLLAESVARKLTVLQEQREAAKNK